METVSEPSWLSAATPENPLWRNSSPATPASAVDDPSNAVIEFDDESWPALSSLPAAQVPPPPPPPSPSSVQQPSSTIQPRPPPPQLLPTPVQPPSPAPEPAAAPPPPDSGAVRPPAARWNPPQRRGRSQQEQRWAPNPRHGGSRHLPAARWNSPQRRGRSQQQQRWAPNPGHGGFLHLPDGIYWPPYHSPYAGRNAGAPLYRPPHHSPYGGGHASAPPYGPPYVDRYHHNSFYPGSYGGEFQIPNGYPMPPPQPVEFHQMDNWLVCRSYSNWNQQNRWRNAMPGSSNNHSGQERVDCQDNHAGVQHLTGQQDPNGQSETLETRVRKKIEYYFCDQNLKCDTYLKVIMDAEGWVDIHKIAILTGVKSITCDIKLVREAMQSSDSVELQDDKLRKRSGWEKYILTTMQNLGLDE